MQARYAFLWVLILLVLGSGMFFPRLMDTDAPEYAGVAMRMYHTGNWAEMMNRSYSNGEPFDYLEKPYLIYWSALPGYMLFGVHDYAYRLLSVLLTLAAALAVHSLARMLYNRTAGAMAAIFFVTAQAIILASHDVRTDSLLTSFCILAIAQMMHYALKRKCLYLLSAGFFLACAVASKGMIAVLVCGSAMFFYLLGKRDWRTLVDWKWIILLLSFFTCLSPVLYCYYQQFDMHPEKLVNGRYGVSGLKHLLWSQSFERFSGTGDFTRESPEFIFFFHTLLWALLPWSLLYYGGTVSRLKELWQTRGRSFGSKEQLTFAGVWVLFLVMSLSKIKLPHYINVLFPLMCIFTAGYLCRLYEEGKESVLRRYRLVQGVLAVLLVVAALVLNLWAFRIRSYGLGLAVLSLSVLAFIYYRRLRPHLLEQVWVPSALVILLLNFLLNTNFYPQVGQYQGGSAMAGKIEANGYHKQDIYLYGYVCRSFDFYMERWSPMLDDKAILDKTQSRKEVLLFTDESNLQRLAAVFHYSILETAPDFHITALDATFLNPATRKNSYKQVYLVKVLSPRS